jgi:hypothetical protein
MRGVAAVGPNSPAYLRTTRSIASGSALVLTLAVVLERPKQRPLDVGAVPGEIEISLNAGSGLRVDREGVEPAAFARHPQSVIAAVLVQIADLERRDLGTPQADR